LRIRVLHRTVKKTATTQAVWVRKLLTRARVGHLATSTRDGRPLVVPICFVFHEAVIYSPIDEKPKRSKPCGLRRILNIVENPNVCFIVDEYDEDWRRLRYAIVHGRAVLLTEGREHATALSLLGRKYMQYHSMRLENRPIIKIRALRVIAWNAQSAS
jgi:PPOX class probable F420-dependent enzyme